MFLDWKIPEKRGYGLEFSVDMLGDGLNHDFRILDDHTLTKKNPDQKIFFHHGENSFSKFRKWKMLENFKIFSNFIKGL